MRRSLIILLAILVSSAAIVGLTSLIAKNVCAHLLVPTGDDLAWFRREFRLSDAEMQRIRQLHDGYMPKCSDMCARIAAKQKELQDALEFGQGLTPEAERKLAEIGALRSQCQAQMLQHFCEVSRAMPAEQGRRYLAEMQRQTLGFHQQIENTMSGIPTSPHEHH